MAFSFLNKDIYSQKKIVVEIQIPENNRKDSLKLSYFPLDFIGSTVTDKKDWGRKLNNGFVKWTFNSDKPVKIYSDIFLNKALYIVEPGE